MYSLKLWQLEKLANIIFSNPKLFSHGDLLEKQIIAVRRHADKFHRGFSLDVTMKRMFLFLHTVCCLYFSHP